MEVRTPAWTTAYLLKKDEEAWEGAVRIDAVMTVRVSPMAKIEDGLELASESAGWDFPCKLLGEFPGSSTQGFGVTALACGSGANAEPAL